MSSVPDTPSVSPSGHLHFVFGVAPRSGTTYLGDLLALHPHCNLPADLPEDGLLKSLHKLDSYTNDLEDFWRAWPDLDVPTTDELRTAIGGGLANMLMQRSGADVTVSKTPFPTHLDQIQSVFPTAKAVVVVRDGRSVTESMVRTWGMKFDMAAALFRDGARSILDAAPDPNAPPAHLRIARYEDLFTDTQNVLAEVLDFFGLDNDEMPESAIADLPVRGSSTERGAQVPGDEVHWGAVERPADFNPLDRFSGWTDRQHRSFAIIAGAENRAFGYASADTGPADRVIDGLFSIRRAGARFVRRHR